MAFVRIYLFEVSPHIGAHELFTKSARIRYRIFLAFGIVLGLYCISERLLISFYSSGPRAEQDSAERRSTLLVIYYRPKPPMGFSAFTQHMTLVSSGAHISSYFRRSANAHGNSHPVIALLHGYPQNNLMWKNFVDEIPLEFSVFVPDLPR
jgi:pimeloyl-ACP methyl ester carboxylesterase